MRILRVVNSLTFRFILRYVIALVASVFAVLSLLYTYLSYSYFTQLTDSIGDELDTLQLVYRGQALPGLRQYVQDQIRAPAGASFSYLLTDASGDKLAGDLPTMPRYRAFSEGWWAFQMSLLRRDESSDVDFIARSRRLDGGLEALVAYNFAAVSESGAVVFGTLLWAMTATLILGIIGGYFTASMAVQRLEGFSQRLSRIVRENPGERMPIKGEEGYLRDLSQVTNRMLDQMSQLMQAIKLVSDNIAHDLRTPLTRVRNNLNQLRDSLEPARQEAVDRVIEDCDDLLATFNALLRISTLESGSRSAPDTEVDLASLLADVVELYEPLAIDKDIRLSLQAPGPHVVRGDNDLLFQLFANLVDNAIKYTPAGGEIAVELGASDSGRRVTVRDSGPGIPVADRKNVFRRFYRLEASRGKEPGHGLGLSLVQAIAHYHRGSVLLASNRPGLRVVVELP
ncbi:sensor histidine kinase [Parahaliea mediterranea]|uniref:sensor histidine kinase n=1 Tax=Parahaliea mediterranea TaxID=651086 RepID=UPI000E2F0564|nr:HAMP domain-containing sensor histidine kinase [Parahaliea mediterranea]